MLSSADIETNYFIVPTYLAFDLSMMFVPDSGLI